MIIAHGTAIPNSKQSIVDVAIMQNSHVMVIPENSVIQTIAHEIDHIMIGAGHPDVNAVGQDPGPAPLLGTDRSKRLMYSGGETGGSSKLLVKAEWDNAEIWLHENVD